VTSSLSPEGYLTVEAPINKPAIKGPVPLKVQHENKEAIGESHPETGK